MSLDLSSDSFSLGSDSSSDGLEFETLREGVARCPSPLPPRIEGLLRHGETLAVEDYTRHHGPELALDLALAVATGGLWLGAFPCVQGKVLLIDHENFTDTVVWRLQRVAATRGCKLADLNRRLGVGFLRNEVDSLDGWAEKLLNARTEGLSLIVIDAFQRMPILNRPQQHVLANWIDALAMRLDCSIALVGRPPDEDAWSFVHTQVSLKATNGKAARLSAEMRSWPPLPVRSLRWTDPVWTARKR